MQKLKLAVASEPVLDEYRETLIGLLRLKLAVQVQDINLITKWRTKEELVANCIEKVLSNQIDFVVLVSRSGNGLQMIANKNEHIRAAPIPSAEYIEDVASQNPNMCEVNAMLYIPESACDLVITLFRAQERMSK